MQQFNSPEFSLQNKVALVTGACGLLGKQFCRALANAGASVIAADLKVSENYWEENQSQNSVIEFDVANNDEVLNAKDKILTKYQTIDILVNNAAINDKFENPEHAAQQSMFENYPLELWQKSIDVNISGVFICSQVFGSVMAKQKSGSIINIASTYGLVGPDQSLYINPEGEQVFYKTPSYPVTKGAVISFTRYLAAYWGKQGVRVNALSPGGVENQQDAWFIKNYQTKTCLGRMAQVNDYNGAIVFLASDASAYMTGANLVIDGGWTTI